MRHIFIFFDLLHLPAVTVKIAGKLPPFRREGIGQSPWIDEGARKPLVVKGRTDAGRKIRVLFSVYPVENRNRNGRVLSRRNEGRVPACLNPGQL